MDINEKSIKIWSTIGSRATLGISALDLAKEIDNLMILTCDVSTSAGLDRFRKTYPEKYLDLGIAEQNMIGVAAGLASENFNVITTTFAPFQTMRCCEQIKVNIGYMKQKICMVGIASGLALGTFGYTHCCIEDVGVLRSIPGMTIISPADSLETVKALRAAVKSENPSYLRLTGTSNNPIVYNQDYEFKIGKSITLKEGKDIAIFATGTMVYESIEASKILETKGISSAVINIHTIKPFDSKLVESISKEVKVIVTVEEHSLIGGLGSCVAEAKSKIKNSAPQVSLGLPLQFGKSAHYPDVLKSYNLTAPQIAQNIIEQFNNV